MNITKGHPLSPDLFKIFLYENDDCPQLLNMSIRHLLWADDLIMLSLDPKTSQKQFDLLNKFFLEWGTEVNEIKTQEMIFASNSIKTNPTQQTFKLGENLLETVDTYCYLGIVLHRTGELRTAQQSPKTKAMKAFFSLKRTVIRSKLSFESLCMLFDSLIKPVVLYGAPIWTPTSATNKSVIKHVANQNNENFISKINRSVPEKIHLSFLIQLIQF